MRKGENKIYETIIVIFVAIILIIVSSKVSNALDINSRSAKYFKLAIVGLIYWIIDMIRSKKG